MKIMRPAFRAIFSSGLALIYGVILAAACGWIGVGASGAEPAPSSVAPHREKSPADWINELLRDLTLSGLFARSDTGLVFQGHIETGNKAQTPLVYALASTNVIQTGLRNVTQQVELTARAIQGDVEELVFEMSGSGEVTEVTGEHLASWSIRKEGNKRSLVARFKSGAPLRQVSLRVSVNFVFGSLPATVTPLQLSPSEVMLQHGTVRLVPAPDRIYRVTEWTGLSPVGRLPSRVEEVANLEAPATPWEINAEMGPMEFKYFSQPYTLVFEVAEAEPDLRRVTFEKFDLRSDISSERARFTLTGTAIVRHPSGGVLFLLGGAAALREFQPVPGASLRHTNASYSVRFTKAGEYPIRAEFDAKITRTEQWNEVAFEVVRSALRPIEVAGVRTNSQVEIEAAAQPELKGDRYISHLSAAGPVKVRWQEQRSKDEGRLFYAASGVIDLAVGSGVYRQTQALDIHVLQGEMTELLLELTGNGEVTRVEVDGLLTWTVRSSGQGNRQLDLRLNQAKKGDFRVQVTTQDALRQLPVKFTPLRVSPVGAIRYGGHLRVANDGAVRLQVTAATGLSQIAPEQLPAMAARPGSNQQFAYRFSDPNYTIEIEAGNIQPEVSVSELLVYGVSDNETSVEAEFELDIREAPLREVSFVIPKGFAVSQLEAPQLSDYFVENQGDPSGTNAVLRLSFLQPLGGRQVLRFRLERNSSEIGAAFALPRVAPLGAKSVRGHVAIAADAGIRITPAAVTGAVETPTAYFPRQSSGLQLAYRLRDADWEIRVATERLALSIQVDALHLFSIGEGVIYGSSVLNYLISGSPVSTFSIELTEDYANAEFIGREIRNWKRSGPMLEVHLHRPVSGKYTLLVNYERPFDVKGASVAFTGAHPASVQSEQGYLVLVSDQQFELTKEVASSGLMPLDPAEVPAEYRMLWDAASLAAYQYTSRPFDLQLRLKSLRQMETVDLIVDRAAFSTQISGDGQALTEARYFIKAKGYSHLPIVMPGSAALWSAKVNGSKVVPVLGPQGHLIPLPQQAESGSPIELELNVATKAERPSRVRIELPRAAAPILWSQWEVRAEPGFGVQYRAGTLPPAQPAQDVSGAAWVLHALRGDWDEHLAVLLMTGLTLLIAGTVLWKWTAARAEAKQTGSYITGLSLGAVAFGVAVACFLALAWAAYEHPLVPPGQLLLAGSVRHPAEPIVLELSATPLGWTIQKTVQILWPILLAAAAWVAAVRSRGCLRLGAWVLGWVFLMLSGLLTVNGAPLFFVLLIAFALVELVWPAARGMARVPRRRVIDGGSGPLPAAGPITALFLIGLWPSAWAASGHSMAQRLSQQARVLDSYVQVRAELRWEAKAGDRVLLLDSNAVLTALKNLPPALSVVQAVPAGHELIARDAGEYEIEFTYQAPVRPGPAGKGFALPTLGALINELALDLPGQDVDVVSPEAVSIERERVKEGTRARVVFAPGRGASIGWQPRSRDPRDEVKAFYAELQHLFVPQPGVVEGVHLVQIRPAQGQLHELVLKIPAGATITDVQAPAVRAWRFDPDEQRLTIQLAAPQAAAFEVKVVSQITARPLPYEQKVEFPTVVDAVEQVGMVGVATGGEVQLSRVESEQAGTINLEDFPPALVTEVLARVPGLTLRRAFRYAGTVGSVSFAAGAVEPDVRMNIRQTVSLGDDRTVLAAELNADIHRAGIFKLSFALPGGMDVEAISGAAMSHWTESLVDGERVVTIHLRSKTEGQQSFSLSLAGAGVGTTNRWEAPRLTVLEASKQTGQLLVVPEQGLRLQIAERTGVSLVDPKEAGIEQKGVLAFRLLQSDWRLAFDVEAVDAWVQVDVIQDVTVREGQFRVSALLDYQIENAAVKSLLIRLPAQADSVQIEGEAVADYARGATDENRALWQVKLQRRVIGNYQLRISYQTLTPERPKEETVLGIVAEGANVQRGYLSVRSSGRLQVRVAAAPPELQPADWEMIPLNLRRVVSSAAPNLTYRILNPAFALNLEVARHESAATLPARVVAVTLTSVVSESGQAVTQYELQLQPGDKRALRVRLPAAATFWFALVNQNSVWPSRDGEEILIPLETPPQKDQFTQVAFYYSSVFGPKVKAGHLLGPEIDLPLEQVTWRVYVPPSWGLEDAQGTLEYREERLIPLDLSGSIPSYIQEEQVRKEQVVQEAESLIALGNSFLQEGDSAGARKAFENAWQLSQRDQAFNEDARVQLHNLKMQQALAGLQHRRDNAFESPSGQAAEAGRSVAPGPVAAEEAAVLNRLAERLISQQEAAQAKPETVRADLPEHGRELTFTRNLLIDPWAELRLDLEFDVKRVTSRRAGVPGAFLALILLSALTGVSRLIRFRRSERAE